MTRSQRIERACELYSRGYNPTDVARELRIARNTARSYRDIYSQRLKEQKEANPHFLQDLVGNTLAMLEELEQVRRESWRDHDMAKVGVECPRCEEHFEIASLSTRNNIMATILKAQSERAKLFGTMGVKQEFFAMVAGVKAVQDALLVFMARELCPNDRAKLDEYLGTPEIQAYMGGGQLDAIEAQAMISESEVA